MIGSNTVLCYPDGKKKPPRSPGVSPITAEELGILEKLDPDRDTLGAILTVKAVFNGTICLPDRQ